MYLSFKGLCQKSDQYKISKKPRQNCWYFYFNCAMSSFVWISFHSVHIALHSIFIIFLSSNFYIDRFCVMSFQTCQFLFYFGKLFLREAVKKMLLRKWPFLFRKKSTFTAKFFFLQKFTISKSAITKIKITKIRDTNFRNNAMLSP